MQLTEEQRSALNEAICWARDDGLPGTADHLRSILAAHNAVSEETISDHLLATIVTEARRAGNYQEAFDRAKRKLDRRAEIAATHAHNAGAQGAAAHVCDTCAGDTK